MVIIVVAVASVALLGILQGITNAKPVSHLKCWLEQTQHQHLGGRERAWDNTQHQCRNGSHYYR
jgi:hypothetical protein